MAAERWFCMQSGPTNGGGRFGGQEACLSCSEGLILQSMLKAEESSLGQMQPAQSEERASQPLLTSSLGTREVPKDNFQERSWFEGPSLTVSSHSSLNPVGQGPQPFLQFLLAQDFNEAARWSLIKFPSVNSQWHLQVTSVSSVGAEAQHLGRAKCPWALGCLQGFQQLPGSQT